LAWVQREPRLKVAAQSAEPAVEEFNDVEVIEDQDGVWQMIAYGTNAGFGHVRRHGLDLGGARRTCCQNGSRGRDALAVTSTGSADQFTYMGSADPVITGISPSSGGTGSGTARLPGQA
jgi:hypothetical protein